MTFKTQKVLLFLALLLVWGQTLAGPFLSCSHQHGEQVAEVTQLSAIAGDAAPQAHAGHHMHGSASVAVPQEAATASSTTGNTHLQQHSSVDCDTSCQYCRGLNLPDLTGPLDPGTALLLSWHSVLRTPTHALPPPTDHFRPPAAV